LWSRDFGQMIVTFLMVFVVQASQNRDIEAVQVKLDGLPGCADLNGLLAQQKF